MTTPTNPNKNPMGLYTVAVSTAFQVGCLLIVAIGLALGLGLLLDRLLGTRPLFLVLLLLGSIPLNLWILYRFTLYKARTLQAPPTQKEETASDD
jgi:F0F1-type ATP synthase assembly protein I